MENKKQLKIIKADGTCEKYLHTKVIGTISKALDAIGRADIFMAEQLADIVTYHLYEQKDMHCVKSNEIFSIIEILLVETGNEDTAVAMRAERQLQMS